ncbi:hypothetical protein CDAR_452551 [Caerostris darwini]|uniref:Uncharacterized protein n=1 Tax=Caerostris darwini TaxID=1538125 RepID=A0AAV4MPD5_9ARAC|nr:hypothetical protein CDAR_452551 [Caerostris darwini]
MSSLPAKVEPPLQMRFKFQTISPDTISESMKALQESVGKCWSSEAPHPDLSRRAYIFAGDSVLNERDLRASHRTQVLVETCVGEKCTYESSPLNLRYKCWRSEAPRPVLPRRAYIFAQDPVSNERGRRASAPS